MVVIVKTVGELAAIAAANPFPEDCEPGLKKLYVTLLEKKLGVAAATRNFATMTALVKMIEDC